MCAVSIFTRINNNYNIKLVFLCTKNKHKILYLFKPLAFIYTQTSTWEIGFVRVITLWCSNIVVVFTVTDSMLANIFCISYYRNRWTLSCLHETRHNTVQVSCIFISKWQQPFFFRLQRRCVGKVSASYLKLKRKTPSIFQTIIKLHRFLT